MIFGRPWWLLLLFALPGLACLLGGEERPTAFRAQSHRCRLCTPEAWFFRGPLSGGLVVGLPGTLRSHTTAFFLPVPGEMAIDPEVIERLTADTKFWDLNQRRCAAGKSGQDRIEIACTLGLVKLYQAGAAPDASPSVGREPPAGEVRGER